MNDLNMKIIESKGNVHESEYRGKKRHTRARIEVVQNFSKEKSSAMEWDE